MRTAYTIAWTLYGAGAFFLTLAWGAVTGELAAARLVVSGLSVLAAGLIALTPRR